MAMSSVSALSSAKRGKGPESMAKEEQCFLLDEETCGFLSGFFDVGQPAENVQPDSAFKTHLFMVNDGVSSERALNFANETLQAAAEILKNAGGIEKHELAHACRVLVECAQAALIALPIGFDEPVSRARAEGRS